MVDAIFEHEGDAGLVVLTTHFNQRIRIDCSKNSDETFRLGGTAINDVVTYEGFITNIPLSTFRAFRSPEIYFEGSGVISPEEWSKADTHCYITEYYNSDMEGQAPGWFISKQPIRDANYLFVNLDVLDGGGNVVKRYRISPFTGEHRVMENING